MEVTSSSSSARQWRAGISLSTTASKMTWVSYLSLFHICLWACCPSDKRSYPDRCPKYHVPTPDRCPKYHVPMSSLLSPSGDIFWFWGLSLCAECLSVSRGKGDLWPLLECWGGRKRERMAALLGEGWWISPEEEWSRCLEVNRPSLSQSDRAKREFLARFSNFDLKKAALPNK